MVLKTRKKVEISDENCEGTFDGEKSVYSRKTQTIYFLEKEPLEEMRKAKPEEFNEILALTAFTPENNNEIKYIESFNLVKKYD